MSDILVITGGLAPQLVTETLYALAQRRRRAPDSGAFWPERIVIAGTQETFEAFEKAGLGIRIAALCVDYDLGPAPSHEYETEARADIRESSDAEPFGTLIASAIRKLTADPTTRLHVSIAGGRKTMSYYAGSALQLYGRSTDELSHVLILPPAAEYAGDFWYPTRESKTVVARDATFDAKDASVDLALIPFLSVRGLLPVPLLGRDLDYSQLVLQAKVSIGELQPFMVLHTADCRVEVPGAGFKLQPAAFALLMLLVDWAKARHIGMGPDGRGGTHVGWLSDEAFALPQTCASNPVSWYYQNYSELRGDETYKRPAWTDTSSLLVDGGERRKQEQKRETKNLGHFRPLWSNLEAAFEANILDPNLRRRYIDKRGVRDSDDDPIRYGLAIDPDAVRVVRPA